MIKTLVIMEFERHWVKRVDSFIPILFVFIISETSLLYFLESSYEQCVIYEFFIFDNSICL